MTGPAQQVWTARLERELDNIRATLAWSAQHDPLAGVRIVSRAALVLGCPRDTIIDACNWLSQLLSRPETAMPARLHARALSILAYLSIARYDVTRTSQPGGRGDPRVSGGG